MSGFLDNYEDVNTRIKRFRAEFPSARMVSVIEDMDLAAGWILFKAEIYREYEDHVPSATGYAYGHVGTYPANMKKWFVEDTETSAFGRAIAALTPSDARPTRQDMERVEYSKPATPSDDLWATLTVTKTEAIAGAEPVGNLLTLVKEDASPQRNPFCSHGEMRLNKSKPGAAKAWSGYFCPAKDRDSQCTPIWL